MLTYLFYLFLFLSHSLGFNHLENKRNPISHRTNKTTMNLIRSRGYFWTKFLLREREKSSYFYLFFFLTIFSCRLLTMKLKKVNICFRSINSYSTYLLYEMHWSDWKGHYIVILYKFSCPSTSENDFYTIRSLLNTRL